MNSKDRISNGSGKCGGESGTYCDRNIETYKLRAEGSTRRSK